MHVSFAIFQRYNKNWVWCAKGSMYYWRHHIRFDFTTSTPCFISCTPWPWCTLMKPNQTSMTNGPSSPIMVYIDTNITYFIHKLSSYRWTNKMHDYTYNESKVWPRLVVKMYPIPMHKLYLCDVWNTITHVKTVQRYHRYILQYSWKI